jgi:hypothetical protein
MEEIVREKKVFVLGDHRVDAAAALKYFQSIPCGILNSSSDLFKGDALVLMADGTKRNSHTLFKQMLASIKDREISVVLVHQNADKGDGVEQRKNIDKWLGEYGLQTKAVFVKSVDELKQTCGKWFGEVEKEDKKEEKKEEEKRVERHVPPILEEEKIKFVAPTPIDPETLAREEQERKTKADLEQKKLAEEHAQKEAAERERAEAEKRRAEEVRAKHEREGQEIKAQAEAELRRVEADRVKQEEAEKRPGILFYGHTNIRKTHMLNEDESKKKSLTLAFDVITKAGIEHDLFDELPKDLAKHETDFRAARVLFLACTPTELNEFFVNVEKGGLLEIVKSKDIVLIMLAGGDLSEIDRVMNTHGVTQYEHREKAGVLEKIMAVMKKTAEPSREEARTKNEREEQEIKAQAEAEQRRVEDERVKREEQERKTQAEAEQRRIEERVQQERAAAARREAAGKDEAGVGNSNFSGAADVVPLVTDSTSVGILTGAPKSSGLSLLQPEKKYPAKPRPWSSRQKHVDLLDERLTPDETTGKLTPKKLMMLYVNYMGIKDVKSDLSKKLEALLVTELDCEAEYTAYLDEHSRRPIFAKDKMDDLTALWLGTKVKAMLVQQFTESDERSRALVEIYPGIVDEQIRILTLLMQCVDKIDKDYYFSRSPQEDAQIEGIINLAGKVYEHLLAPREVGAAVELEQFIAEFTITRDAKEVIEKHVATCSTASVSNSGMSLG